MKRIYVAHDPIVANLLKARLEDAGIHAVIQDERTHALRGEMPLVYPSVWVHDSDVEAGLKLASEMEQAREGPAWICPVCETEQDASFAECWKCAQKPEVNVDAGRDADAVAAPAPGARKSGVFLAILFFCIVAGGVALLMKYGQEQGDYQAHFEQGYNHASNGRLDAAIKSYDAALAIRPDSTDILINRGSVWMDKKDYARAVVDYDRVLELDPKAEGVHEARAYAHSELGHLTLALKDSLTARSNQPFRTQIRAHILQAKFELGDLDGAWLESEALRKEENFRYTAARFRSAILEERNRIQEAVMETELAIVWEPKSVEAYVDLARIHSDKGEFDKALELCDKAAGLNAEDVWEKVTRGCVLFKLNRKIEAQNVMRKVVKLATDDRRDLSAKISAYMVLEDDVELDRAVQEQLKRSPESRWAYFEAAEAALWQARNADPAAVAQAIDRAIDYLEEAKKRGFIAWHDVTSDAPFKGLLDHPRFKKLAGLP